MSDDFPFARGSKRVKEYYDKYTSAKAAFNQVKALVDESLRPGEVVRLGADITTRILSRVTGTDVTKHPYYKFHETHIEMLAQVATATRAVDIGAGAYKAAVAAAGATQSLSRHTDDIKSQFASWYATWDQHVAGMQFAFTIPIAPAEQKQVLTELMASGHSYEETFKVADDLAEEWCGWLGRITDQAITLFSMTKVEAGAAERAASKYKSSLKAIQAGQSGIGANIAVVAEYALERRILEEQVYQATRGKSNYTPELMNEPLKHAKNSLARVEKVAMGLADCCVEVRTLICRCAPGVIEAIITRCATLVRNA